MKCHVGLSNSIVQMKAQLFKQVRSQMQFGNESRVANNSLRSSQLNMTEGGRSLSVSYRKLRGGAL